MSTPCTRYVLPQQTAAVVRCSEWLAVVPLGYNGYGCICAVRAVQCKGTECGLAVSECCLFGGPSWVHEANERCDSVAGASNERRTLTLLKCCKR